MNTHTRTIQGRHWRTGDWIEIRCDHQHIVSVENIQPNAAIQNWLAPGLIDLQINGYGGIDFQRDTVIESEWIQAIKALHRDGCPRFLLTLITAPWPVMMRRLRHFKSIRDANPKLMESCVGWHIEGPFLSEEPGYCGAHQPACMEDPTLEHIRTLRSTAGDDPVLLTLAPERPGSLEAIEEAIKLGIQVSLGHTNADSMSLQKAAKAGAMGFTHLGNACPQQLDRHDNLLFRAIDNGPWMTGLIPDKIHVSPTLFRMFHRLIPRDHIYYTTDAMSAAGAEPGRYTIGNLELEVGEDQIVRQPGKSNFAGSALRPCQGVVRAANMLGSSWREVWEHFSETPARWMHLPTGLAPGSPSNFCIVEERPGKELSIQVIEP